MFDAGELVIHSQWQASSLHLSVIPSDHLEMQNSYALGRSSGSTSWKTESVRVVKVGETIGRRRSMR